MTSISVAFFFFNLAAGVILGIMPVFMVEGLGASGFDLGLLMGAGELFAAGVLITSGITTDKWKRRKPLLIVGYALSALAKSLLLFANTLSPFVICRLGDRMSIALFTPPQDALIGDLSGAARRGRAYGFVEAVGAVGAMTGPFLAALTLALTGTNWKASFLVAALASALALLVVMATVSESPKAPEAKAIPIRLQDLPSVGKSLYGLLGITFVVVAARMTELYATLVAKGAGLSSEWTPLVFVLVTAGQAASAYPAGWAADRFGKIIVLTASLVLLIPTYLILSAGRPMWTVFVAALLWGTHYGLSGTALAALVVERAPKHYRGTAFGLFRLANGLAALVAMSMAGIVWDVSGPRILFSAWIGITIVAIGVVGFWWQSLRRAEIDFRLNRQIERKVPEENDKPPEH